MDRLTAEQLVDLEDIRRLKARYCRYIDTKQWDLLGTLFADDVRFDGFGAAPNGSGKDAFLKGVQARLKDAFSLHHCHTPDIVFIDHDTARGVWTMEDYLEWPQPIGLPDFPNARGMQGFGHYEEEYRRVNGIWKMRHLRLRRMRMFPLRDDHPGKQTTPTWPAGNDWLPG
jgi:hypothetical protein